MASVADLLKRAVASFQMGQFDDAERSFKQALRKDPRNLLALNVLAITLVTRKKFAEAEPYLRTAAGINPTSDATLSNYGLVLKALGRPDEAAQRLTQAIALNPGNAETWITRGAVLNDLDDPHGAIADFEKAIAIDPNHPAAWFNKSKSLVELRRTDEALAACDRALAQKPDFAEAWFGRGFILQKMRRHEEAAGAYAQAYRIDPQIPLLKGNLLHQKMLTCDWDGTDHLIAEIERDLDAGRLSAEPFGWQGVAVSERSLQQCAKLYSATKYPAMVRRSDPPTDGAGMDTGMDPGMDKGMGANGRIRIGYLSGEFRQQATSLLMVGVLEHHDREKFEVHAIDNGWDDGSDIRQRINAAVQGVVDIRTRNDLEAVAAIRACRIDILVNLNGYFGDDRTRVFARRAAPIQVNYLGFPGTLGALYIDYIIADHHVLPTPHWPFYAEQPVLLPHCYQANDRDKPISPRVFGRAECGLPASGFVFCCFNNSYKITPGLFDVWMRILRQVDGSVLWLLEDSAAAAAHLRREATARGVSPDRIVFAGRMPLSEHLARHRCADLFLDTLPYNAHTTASDALWAGLPVLTCLGETFAGRVAASLLHAVGLPDMIAPTLPDYERMAIELAADPARLADIARRLADNRMTAPLFDTRLFTRHIEAAYTAMAERYRAGQPPQPIIMPA